LAEDLKTQELFADTKYFFRGFFDTQASAAILSSLLTTSNEKFSLPFG
jgi:hypothetical protein